MRSLPTRITALYAAWVFITSRLGRLFDEFLIVWRFLLTTYIAVAVLQSDDLSTAQASVLGIIVGADVLKALLEYSRGRNQTNAGGAGDSH
ncbi:MAG TPA: hypothetical protein DCZ13_02560 [Porticoccaceae bacterium]|nr:hypothetical protein [Porticoccaceae bacterium]